MKKLRGSLAAKITAIVLLCVLVLVFVMSVLGIYTLTQWGAYTYDLDTVRLQAVERLGSSHIYSAWQAYVDGSEPEYIEYGGNFRFTILDPAGKELYSSYDGEEVLWQGSRTMLPDIELETLELPVPALMQRREATPEPEEPVTPTPVPTAEPGAETAQPQWNYRLYNRLTGETVTMEDYSQVEQWRQENRYTVRGYVLSDLSRQDEFGSTVRLLYRLWGLRYALYGVAAASLLLGVLLFIFLCGAAGHRDGSDAVTANFVDKIPFDLFTALVIAGVGISLVATLEASSIRGGEIILGMLMILAAGLLFLLWCMSLATRVKLGTLWKNCLCWQLVAWCWKGLRLAGHGLAALLRSLPLIRRWALIIAAVWLFEFIFLAIWHVGGDIFFLWFLEHLLLTALAFYLILSFRRLRLGAKEIAAGNERCEVDGHYLIGELAEHAADLNHIRDGMSAAVAERMKSERFRTELITNVSHDIKTPLTSIVNYVDLLAKEEPESGKVREYVEVLSRQSARLKKLIDDLIEASKASTGSLPVEKERCELGVLLDQTAGEYGEKLEAARLELVLDKPEKPVSILADGRHMWRVFDNLMGNAVKYAQPDTRVYLSLEEWEGKAVVTFRNISRSRLNISGEELRERFVRGDSSRNTEGSGLGLSIAESLVRLQGGEMSLSVDGDLFKVTLSFDLMNGKGEA